VATCEKAMAREIGHRYHDTEALASDLRAFLEQCVVSAYEAGALAELRKWVTRNKALASSIAAAELAVVGGLLWVQSERVARRAQATRAALERSERDRGIESGVSLALGRAGSMRSRANGKPLRPRWTARACWPGPRNRPSRARGGRRVRGVDPGGP